jgi:acyl-CoA synthetase (NDP forming)/RimJ/RimL family protein N-acetyltransferase
VSDAATSWPEHWEVTVATADGGAVHIRPITPDDADRLVEFHGRQSPESIYFRYFTARPRLSPAEVRNFTHVDLVERVALIALLEDELIGVGRFDRYRGTTEAEVAFFIDDAHHGRGLATILLEYLAMVGRELGLTAFVASVLPTNRGMLAVFTGAGFETVTKFSDGVVEVRFEIAPTPASVAAAEERAGRAEARSVARLMEPRSVAVIGAGRTPGTMGHEILRQLIGHGFAGPVYAVNREATHVASVPAWPSVLDLPGTVDLAVIAVPADEVLAAVEECGRARVGAIVVVSAGFAEDGDEGLARARELVRAAHRSGVRLLGPASLGVINTSPEVCLHASYAPATPVPGRVGLSLQSGGLGTGIVLRATARGLGFSSVASVGDKLDVSGNDLLSWWEHDDRTDVVVLSLASYGNPRRFRRLARRVATHKPVIITTPHDDGSAAELLAQLGVLPVSTFDGMLDVACLLAGQPLPTGGRVALVAETKGSAAYAASACVAAGLEVSSTRLVGTDAAPARYEEAVAAALSDETEPADSVLVVYSSPIEPRPQEVALAVAAGADGATRPVVASFAGFDVGGFLPGTGPQRVPDLGFPDAAAAALGAVTRYARWRSAELDEPGDVAGDGPDPAEAARSLVDARLAAVGDGPVPVDEAMRLLGSVGATVVETRVVSTADEAAGVADDLGGAVALKAIGRSATAKSEAAGVALDLHGGADAAASWGRTEAAMAGAGTTLDRAVVQPMVGPGSDVRVLVDEAPIVGSRIGLGAGGAQPEGFLPLVHAVLPLSPRTAKDLVERAGLARLLDAAGRDALVDLLVATSHLADEVPEVQHLDLNPVIVASGKACVVDARIELAAEPDRPPEDLRRLSS